MRFQGKVILITGAVGGIGEETARRFVSEGAKVALLDMNEDGMKSLAVELGSSAIWHYCDVTNEESVSSAYKAAFDHFGKVNSGVLIAGISGKRQPFKDIGADAYDQVMAVNARGVFLCLKHLYPLMKKNGSGSIVVTASTEGLRGNAGLAPYVASKHAVIGMVKTAALEWAEDNIRVNCVNPCPVDTPMMRAIEQGYIEKGVTNVREKYTDRIPLKRYATTGEVAGFIAFLASEEASYSTGGTYLVDGGVLAGALLVKN